MDTSVLEAQLTSLNLNSLFRRHRQSQSLDFVQLAKEKFIQSGCATVHESVPPQAGETTLGPTAGDFPAQPCSAEPDSGELPGVRSQGSVADFLRQGCKGTWKAAAGSCSLILHFLPAGRWRERARTQAGHLLLLDTAISPTLTQVWPLGDHDGQDPL